MLQQERDRHQLLPSFLRSNSRSHGREGLSCERGKPTLYVLIQQVWELVQQQTLDIDLPQSLFQGPGTVCDDVDNLCDKGLVRGDLIVPCLHEVT